MIQPVTGPAAATAGAAGGGFKKGFAIGVVIGLGVAALLAISGVLDPIRSAGEAAPK